LVKHRIHLLILDPFPPGPRAPNGIHTVIWAEVEDEPFVLSKYKPLTLVAYEGDLTTRACIQPVAVGDVSALVVGVRHEGGESEVKVRESGHRAEAVHGGLQGGQLGVLDLR